MTTTVDDVTVGAGVGSDGAGVGSDGAVVCVEDGLSHHRAEVDTVVVVSGGEVQAAAGVNACVLSDWACTYHGGITDVRVGGDRVDAAVMPTVCPNYAAPYSHCVSVFAFAAGSASGIRADMFVCDESSAGFACTSDDDLKKPALQATKPIMLSIVE